MSVTLMGLAVILQTTGETIGTVIDVYRAGNDLLEVALVASDSPCNEAKPKTALIPFVEAIVPVVDLEPEAGGNYSTGWPN